MKRILLYLLLITSYCSLSAQNLDYYYRVKNDAGKAAKRAELFIERGKTDKNGCFKMNAKLGYLAAAAIGAVAITRELPYKQNLRTESH